MEKIHPLLKNLPASRFISLDAEFADGKYMLELSICDNLGQTVYNQRFKPREIDKWLLVPHNISPEDVKDMPHFDECLPEIQKIINDADFILGFALENDIRMLKKEGVRISREKNILELRDWFWILYGKNNGLDYSERISNETIAENLHIPADADRLHSALYDAEISLESFHRILYNLEEAGISEDSLEKVFPLFQEKFKTAKEEYDREHAAGYCTIQKLGDRYKVRFSALEPEEDETTVAAIKVANRKKAQLDISRMLLGKNFAGNFTVDRITAPKLARFKSYSNSFDTEECAIDTKLLKLTQLYSPRKRRK